MFELQSPNSVQKKTKISLGDLVKLNQNTESISTRWVNKLTFPEAADGDEAIKVRTNAVVTHGNEDGFSARGRRTVETN